MKEYIPVLKNCRLFAGLEEGEIVSMLSCLEARQRKYQKGEYVLCRGRHTDCVMVLAKGRLHIQRDDYWGSRSILSSLEAGDIFGEAYADPESGPMLNDVAAVEDSIVLFFNAQKLLGICPSACAFHSRVVQNLYFTVSEKNRLLLSKLSHMSRRSTREKLMSYLSEQAGRSGQASFSIPFNRQQLADYLSVDRSAMSAELGRMRDEGLLRFEKNKFTLL